MENIVWSDRELEPYPSRSNDRAAQEPAFNTSLVSLFARESTRRGEAILKAGVIFPRTKLRYLSIANLNTFRDWPYDLESIAGSRQDLPLPINALLPLSVGVHYTDAACTLQVRQGRTSGRGLPAVVCRWRQGKLISSQSPIEDRDA
jgi:hypothetical protein